MSSKCARVARFVRFLLAGPHYTREAQSPSPLECLEARQMLTNIAPVVDINATEPVLYSKGDPPVLFLQNLTISDADDTHLLSATVELTNNYESNHDTLAIGSSLASALSVSISGNTLTIIGLATVNEYRDALRTVTFENTSGANEAVRTATVTVTDANLIGDLLGPSSGTATAAIDMLLSNRAPSTSDATFVIDENAAIETTVGTVSASDPNPTNTLSYAIVAGNDSGAFAIDAASGAITVADSAPLDFETSGGRITLTVRVSDDGDPVAFDEATINVDLNNVNEAPDVIAQHFFTYADAVAASSLGFVDASDPDAGQSLTYSLLSGNTGGAFALDSASGELTVANPAALTSDFTLTVRVSDGQSPALTDTATVSITVLDDTSVDLLGFDGTNWFAGQTDGISFTTRSLGGFSGGTPVHIVRGDFDRNGFTDAAGLDAATGEWRVLLSNGTSVTEQVWDTWDVDGVTYENVVVGDFNGDGRDDIAARRVSDGDWRVAISGESAFETSRFGRWKASLTWDDASIGDFNGDGLDDIAGRNAVGSWWVSLSNGDSFGLNWFGKWSASVTWDDPSVGDFNGDGRDDIAGRTNGNWWISLSNHSVVRGDHFVVSHFNRWRTDGQWEDVSVGDFNGDGTDDIAARFNGNWWVGESDGSRLSMQHYGRWSQGADWTHATVGDFNGDGRDDIVGRANGAAWWVSTSHLDGGEDAFTLTYWGNWAAGRDLDFVSVANVFS